MTRRKPDAEPPLLIDRREAARLLGVCERTLQTLEKRGDFTPVRIGRQVRRRLAVQTQLARR